jgi:predicted TPR repeat methyltransferase
MIAESESTGNNRSVIGRTLGDEVGLEAPYAVRFPNARRGGKGAVAPGKIDFAQDEEWCEVLSAGRWRQLRLHDYADIYKAPGLYEHIFEGLLRCNSPRRVVGLLAEVLQDWRELPTDLSVIDLGAGNGMVGEELRRLGVRGLVGVDIIPEAAEAARRDRPGIYDDYVVADLCDLSEGDAERLGRRQPNCLSTVSALGFGDIPTRAFATAFNLIATPGWLAFNIKESFLNASDASGFARLIHLLAEREIIQVQAYRRYSHRLSVSGRRLNYVAMTARKLREIPESLLGEVE